MWSRVYTCLLSLIFCLYSSLSIAQQWVADVDLIDFENQKVVFDLIGTPVNDPVNASASITSAPDEVFSGEHGLKLSYELNEDASAALLDVKFLLTDLVSISFWIKSENEANWVVYIRDENGAGFIALTEIVAGQWQFVSLVPTDFTGLEENDPPKADVDADILDIGLAMVDARNKYGPPGEANTVYLDDIRIARAPLQNIEGDYVVSGGQDTIEIPTHIDGDLIVENGAQLDVTATRFQVRGNVTVTGGSTLNFDGGAWQFQADYPKQYLISASESSSLFFRNGKFRLKQNLEGDISDNSLLRFDDVRNGTAGMTFSIRETATLELNEALYVGEFIISENTQSSVTDSELVVFWVDCTSDFPSPVVLPDGASVTTWTSPVDWDRDISITNSIDVFWTFNVLPFCQLDIEDSTIRAIGMTYWHPGPVPVGVGGLQPDLLYEDFCISATTSSVCLRNSLVESWNVYSTGEILLYIEESTLGEMIAFDDSRVIITNTLIDGKGGHLGSQDRSVVRLFSGQTTADIRTYHDSAMDANDSTISGNIFASGDSQVTLKNTILDGSILTFENATVTEE